MSNLKLFRNRMVTFWATATKRGCRNNFLHDRKPNRRKIVDDV